MNPTTRCSNEGIDNLLTSALGIEPNPGYNKQRHHVFITPTLKVQTLLDKNSYTTILTIRPTSLPPPQQQQQHQKNKEIKKYIKPHAPSM